MAGRVSAHPPLIIERVDAIPVALPLRQPMKMAHEVITHARNIVVRIVAADSTLGWGEAASAPTMTGDTLGGLVAAVRDHLAPRLIGRDAWDRPALVAMLRAGLIGNTGAHSAIEMALLDLAGRKAGMPLIDLIGEPRRHAVAPMWLLGRDTLEEDVAEAAAKVRDGFRFFKLKVATKAPDQDVATTHALRAALGPNFPIVGVGGIVSPEQGVETRAAGADLLQLYTGLIYRGPALVTELLEMLDPKLSP